MVAVPGSNEERELREILRRIEDAEDSVKIAKMLIIIDAIAIGSGLIGILVTGFMELLHPLQVVSTILMIFGVIGFIIGSVTLAIGKSDSVDPWSKLKRARRKHEDYLLDNDTSR